MMKWISIAILLFVLSIGVAQAAPVTVDFGVLGGSLYSITTPDAYTLDGVTFHYDNFGVPTETAQVDEYGVFGSGLGSLYFDFASPASSLNIDFSIIGVYGALNNAMSVTFYNAGGSVGSLSGSAADFFAYYPGNDLLGGDAVGALAYGAATFDQAVITFSSDVPYFSIDTLSYEPATGVAPEPSALAVLAAGLLGMRITRRKR